MTEAPMTEAPTMDDGPEEDEDAPTEEPGPDEDGEAPSASPGPTMDEDPGEATDMPTTEVADMPSAVPTPATTDMSAAVPTPAPTETEPSAGPMSDIPAGPGDEPTLEPTITSSAVSLKLSAAFLIPVVVHFLF
jgi:hypothetical protein